MRKVMLFLLLLLAGEVFGAVVTESEARQTAMAFMSARGKTQADMPVQLSARKAAKRSATASDYYIFNMGNGQGYVVVSGDDRTVPILGYADEGAIVEGDIPDGLQYLLDGYSEQMEWLDANGIDESYNACEARATRKASARTAIAPLIQTRWNQGAPYNNFCPEIDGEKAVTGCVATTLAQLMYYHKLPQESTTAIPGYPITTEDKDKNAYTLNVPQRNATVFDWNNMTKTYADNATGAAADAVATLMLYCGSALQMTYGLSANGGSSAYSEAIPYALKTYFGYDGGVHHTYRSNYSYVEWVDLIYGELSEGRPVALGGQSTGGGHSFICDGYQSDDYFHINWGWGGSSDGYYRLSLLNPYEQGIGGSSTLDGFSYSQDAVIGIQPPVSGNKDYCLSLEGLRLGSSNTQKTSMTFTRTNGEFTDISLYFLVFCYNQGSTAFDFAVQLVDGSNQVVKTFYEETKTMTWNQYNTGDNNSGKGRTITGISIPSSVADGTYYIKVASRPSGTNTWQECFDGDRYQLTAVISDDELTITVPRPSAVYPTQATLSLNENVHGYLTQGYEQEVTANITGGSIDYHGNVILCVNKKPVMGKTLDIPAGQSVIAHYAYIPSEYGNNELALYRGLTRDSNNEIIGSGLIGSSKTVTINESDASNTQTIGVNHIITNLTSDNKLYGNAVHIKVTVSNPSTTNSYVSKLNCSLRKYNKMTDDVKDYIDAEVQSKTVEIAKSESEINLSTAEIDFVYDGVEAGKAYRMRFTYTQGYTEDGKTKKKTVEAYITDPYEMGEGYLVYDSDGSISISPKDDVNLETALCVDLTAISDFTGITVTPSSNPNCLYLLKSDATVPSSLTGANVVKDGVAEQITLTDASDFWSPIEFTANQMSYSRTFTVPAGESGGWSTIMLPFDVAKVEVEGKTVDWFHSASDTGKNFWVKTFTGDGSGKVYFDFADEMKANVPYIIAVPGNDWGEDWKMTGKVVTFISKENQVLKATQVMKQSGDVYNFCGTTKSEKVKDVYMLNDGGNKFVKKTDETSSGAFRAWFGGSAISSLSRQALSIGSGSPTGISEMEDGKMKIENGVYDLQGRRMESSIFNSPLGSAACNKQESSLKKGLYIKNGKKILVR